MKWDLFCRCWVGVSMLHRHSFLQGAFPALKPRPNAHDFSLYIAQQMSSVVECCQEGVAKRSRLFTRLGTQHSTDVLFDE